MKYHNKMIAQYALKNYKDSGPHYHVITNSITNASKNGLRQKLNVLCVDLKLPWKTITRLRINLRRNIQMVKIKNNNEIIKY